MGVFTIWPTYRAPAEPDDDWREYDEACEVCGRHGNHHELCRLVLEAPLPEWWSDCACACGTCGFVHGCHVDCDRVLEVDGPGDSEGGDEPVDDLAAGDTQDVLPAAGHVEDRRLR